MDPMDEDEKPRTAGEPALPTPDDANASSKTDPWPAPPGALGAAVGSSAEPALEPSTTTPPDIVPRPGLLPRAIRGLLLILGCIGLLTASVLEAHLPAHSWVNLPAGIGVGALSLGVLRVRGAWIRSAPPANEVRQRRAARRRQIRVAFGFLLLAGSVVAATIPVPPDGPVFLSSRAACGSAVLTRSLVAQKKSPLLKNTEAQFDEFVGAVA
jgi:hypothetical protein